MDRSRVDSIIEIVDETLSPLGFVCIEAEWDVQDRIFRIFIDWKNDKPALAITVDECVAATKLINELSLLDGMIEGSYSLEVSSPGVERPLRRDQDFRRFLGSTIEVKLIDRYQDRKHGKGRLVDVKGMPDGQSMVTLDTSRGPWEFALSALQRASLVYDWGNS